MNEKNTQFRSIDFRVFFEVDWNQRSLYKRWQQLRAVYESLMCRGGGIVDRAEDWKLHHLQANLKWIDGVPNVKAGQLVLLREAQPMKLPLTLGDDRRVWTVSGRYHDCQAKKVCVVMKRSKGALTLAALSQTTRYVSLDKMFIKIFHAKSPNFWSYNEKWSLGNESVTIFTVNDEIYDEIGAILHD